MLTGVGRTIEELLLLLLLLDILLLYLPLATTVAHAGDKSFILSLLSCLYVYHKFINSKNLTVDKNQFILIFICLKTKRGCD